jgi:L-alanine-DL-glutamate epimerase-like enolase superfamily enzyme
MDGVIGFGEATLPPYLGVTIADVMNAFKREGLSQALNLPEPNAWFEALNATIPDVMPALAAIDMARWSIYTQLTNRKVYEHVGHDSPSTKVPHTYTLGVSSLNEMSEKLLFALDNGFELFKLKLDGKNDRLQIDNFRSLSTAPFAIDVNQAWTDLKQAEQLLDILEEEGCILIEQPFVASDRALTRLLSEKTEIPVIADESCQSITDLLELLEVFDGVNVKLQKCGGITPAIQQLKCLKEAGKRALIGCMSESSVGCNAAEQLTFLCDWADLDGPYLNVNNEKCCLELGYSL